MYLDSSFKLCIYVYLAVLHAPKVGRHKALKTRQQYYSFTAFHFVCQTTTTIANFWSTHTGRMRNVKLANAVVELSLVQKRTCGQQKGGEGKAWHGSGGRTKDKTAAAR